MQIALREPRFCAVSLLLKEHVREGGHEIFCHEENIFSIGAALKVQLAKLTAIPLRNDPTEIEMFSTFL